MTLRWHDVDFERRKPVVRRAVSGGVEAPSTRSLRAREVPLADQAAGARLSQRGDFTHGEDYVFANRLGRRLDRLGAAASSRSRARSRRGFDGCVLHDLRHSRITTTERYLHV